MTMTTKVDGGYDAEKNMRGVSETNDRHVKERHVVAEAYLHLLREPLPSPFWFERFMPTIRPQRRQRAERHEAFDHEHSTTHHPGSSSLIIKKYHLSSHQSSRETGFPQEASGRGRSRVPMQVSFTKPPGEVDHLPAIGFLQRASGRG